MKVTAKTLRPSMIRALYNGARDGTASDAVMRQLCQIALGERCLSDDMPGGLRYPTEEEIAGASMRLAVIWNAHHADDSQ